MVNMIISMFIKVDILPSLDSDVEASHFYSERRPHGEVSKASICDLSVRDQPNVACDLYWRNASGTCDAVWDTYHRYLS